MCHLARLEADSTRTLRGAASMCGTPPIPPAPTHGDTHIYRHTHTRPPHTRTRARARARTRAHFCQTNML